MDEAEHKDDTQVAIRRSKLPLIKYVRACVRACVRVRDYFTGND